MSTIMTALGFVISLNTNGYIKLPSCLGGLIIQWGIDDPGTHNNSTRTVTLPITYPTQQLFAISSTEYYSGSSGFAGAFQYISSLTISTIVFTYTISRRWISIGY